MGLPIFIRSMGNGKLYRSSDGRYFGDADIWERLESGEWKPCCWDEETGEEWVETRNGELLELQPIPSQAVPDWIDIDHDVDGVRLTQSYPMSAD
jgi:hypothetical protein